MFSKETGRVLRAAGWWPGRRVDTAAWRAALEEDGFRVHDAAERFLAEYGGLDIRDNSVSGYFMARPQPVRLDPMLLLGEADRFADWGARAGHSLCGVGELTQYGTFAGFLGIDEESVIYLVSDWLGSFGPLPEALDPLVLGGDPEVINA
ncbi:MAG TPA: SUKH-3 domain-containing protein [Thermomonospora sp.]|nr:SUKH-3 domain-containing protein [Thermomonospora sp.]